MKLNDNLLDQIALAEKGDAASAVRAAVLIFTRSELAQSLGLQGRYEKLLLQALDSKSPEFLVAVGEELFIGKTLAVDAKLAYRFFVRADELSTFMGSYILARLIYKASPSHAIRLLKKGELEGHVPSRIFRHILVSERFGLLGPIVKLWYRLSDGSALHRAIAQPDVKRRLWRYRDLGAGAFELADKEIGPDQRLIFRGLFDTNDIGTTR